MNYTHGNLNRVDFLAGQYFDIRLEVHAPVNGSQANGGKPDENFTFTIAKAGQAAQNAATYFKVAEPNLERWNFTWYEGTLASPKACLNSRDAHIGHQTCSPAMPESPHSST